MVICEAEEETADMTDAVLLRKGTEESRQLERRRTVCERPLVVEALLQKSNSFGQVFVIFFPSSTPNTPYISQHSHMIHPQSEFWFFPFLFY